MKNLDEKLYREIKAEAAKKGLTVSEVVESALEEWLKKRKFDEDKDFLLNNFAFERNEEEIFKDHMGEWIAIEKGRIVAASKHIEELREKLGTVNHRIIFKVERKAGEKRYIGGSSLCVKRS